MLNLASILETSAREVPNKEAIVLGDQRMTYQQLDQVANQVAHGLVSKGIEKGDKVALSCPNVPYFPVVYFGILKAGAVVVPLNVLLKPQEIAYHLNDSQARAYFCFQGTTELPMAQFGRQGFSEASACEHFVVLPSGLENDGEALKNESSLPEFIQNKETAFQSCLTNGDDTALILYTSGTTGKPKGAELTHMSIFLNAQISRDIMDGRSEDVHLVCLPLFHSFGQICQMNQAIFIGARQVLLPKFEPHTAWQIMAKEEITVFAGVPTMYWALLQQKQATDLDFSAIAKILRICVSGGAPMPVEIMNAFEEQFSVPILEGYGLSETSPVATFSRLDRERKVGSVGLPIWGVEIRVVNREGEEVAVGQTGEIAVRGHNVMKGYYRREEATQASIRNGWFHTGDMGKKDEDGYLYIVDRLKDMIIRGGFNVYPRELEEVLLEHPDISLAAVIGVPHPQHGEEIKAFLVPKEGRQLAGEDIKSWAKQRMAAYKYPRLIEIRDQLPMTATGKILKTTLREEQKAGQ